MNIATGIIALVLSAIVLFQSCVANLGGSLGKNEALTLDAALGGLAAFGLLIGGALAFKLPRAAMVVFLIGALPALLLGKGAYGDLRIWGWVLVILAVMAFFAGRKKASQAP
jgi:uncharacterized membrane protein